MKSLASDIPFEAVILQLEETDEGRMAWVEYRGVRVRVSLALVPDARPGDRVLVQGRTALSVLIEESRNAVH